MKSDKHKPDVEKRGPEGKKGQRKNSEKEKGIQKVGRKKERKSSQKYLRKEKLRLKQEVSKLKDQREKIKREIRRANQKRKKINGHGKEIGANCRTASSRDAECVEKLATWLKLQISSSRWKISFESHQRVTG